MLVSSLSKPGRVLPFSGIRQCLCEVPLFTCAVPYISRRTLRISVLGVMFLSKNRIVVCCPGDKPSPDF